MNIPNTAKSNRLHGERFSFKEIRHLQEKKKCHSMKYSDNQRIIIGMNDIQQLILIDGRHLLEAHRKLYKIVPKYLVGFINIKIEKLFTSKYKGLKK